MYLWNPLWNFLYRTWLSALILSYWITQVYNPKDVFLQMYFALICDTVLWHSAALWFYVFPTHRLIELSVQTSSHTSPSSEARVFLMLFCRVQVLLWLRTIQKLALLSIILLCQLWNGNVFWIFLISLLITQSWISAKKKSPKLRFFLHHLSMETVKRITLTKIYWRGSRVTVGTKARDWEKNPFLSGQNQNALS